MLHSIIEYQIRKMNVRCALLFDNVQSELESESFDSFPHILFEYSLIRYSPI